MPYLPSQARLKSDAYQKILDADITEQDEKLRDLIAKQQVSGSGDANNPTRDEANHARWSCPDTFVEDFLCFDTEA